MPARNQHLPRHLAWPLTATDIGDALGSRMAHVGKLRFDPEPSAAGTLLRVEWVPAVASNYGAGAKPADMLGVQIRVSPLKAVDRPAARAVLREAALPELDTWIRHALQATDSWLQVRHDRCWQIADGRLIHREGR